MDHACEGANRGELIDRRALSPYTAFKLLKPLRLLRGQVFYVAHVRARAVGCLGRLRDSPEQGLEALGGRIEHLMELVSTDMSAYGEALDKLENTQRHAVAQSANHLLALGGKRLRPMCVGLAARLGDGFTKGAFDLGIAAELVHMATLLHDDVVDQGEVRRGQPAARMLYGNAASVFAGTGW